MLSPVVGLAVLASVLTAVLAVYGWRRRADPGGRWFAGLMLSSTVWAGVYAVGLSIPATEATLRVGVERVMFVGVTGVVVTWPLFAATYSGQWTDPGRTRRRAALLGVVPAVALVGALTNPAHGLFISNAGPVAGDLFGPVTTVVYDYEPLFVLLAVYGIPLVFAGTVLLLRTALTAEDLYTDQALALAVGAFAGGASNVLSVIGWVPVPGMDITPFGLAVTGVAFANALARYRFLDRVPATHRLGRAAVVENVRDGVVVVDANGDVTDVNPVAASLLGADRTDVVGRPAATALAPVLESAPDAAGVTALDGATVEVDGDWFEVRVSPLSNRADRHAGSVLTLRDVTTRRTREQRLQVMNRLLRHNFRNEVTVVHGFAELLDDRLDGREGEMAARVHEVAAELVERVEKAAGVERIADLDEVDPDVVHLGRLASDLVDEIEGVNPNADLRVRAPDGPVYARIVLENAETVLRNLLENAVEHNDTERPTVTVTVSRRGDDRVAVAVADDGPGLPRHERQVLEAGRETELEHGSGIGLWLVYWGVQVADGTVRFEDNDPRGTVVSVALPAADPDAADATPVPLTDGAARPIDDADGERSPVDAGPAAVDPASGTGDTPD